MGPSGNPDIHRKFTRLYLLALSAVAALTMAGQLLIQQSLQQQLSDSRVINVAGRQRMLSQKISKLALLLHQTSDPLRRKGYVQELQDALALWQISHYSLKKGHLNDLNASVHNSQAILQIFATIEPHFTHLYQNAHAISTQFQNNSPSVASGGIERELAVILAHEPQYLAGMDQIVFQYDAEANERVNHTRSLEWGLLCLTLFILLFEGLFVFKPAVRQIKSTIGQLLQAERHTQQVNQELLQVNQQLSATQAALLQATTIQYQKEMDGHKLRSVYLLEGQEEERKRLALEIHDGLGQMLTALKFGIEKVSDSVEKTEKAQQDISHLRDLVSQTIAEIRSISFDLMPAVLLDFGLAPALKLLASQTTSNTGIPVTFTTNYTGKRIARNTETGLYRICQEALQNALKYAGAQTISVELFARTKYLHLKIKDNGRGIAGQETLAGTEITSPAHGISNMKERAHLLNGKMEICSTPGKGTHIHVKIPHHTVTHA